MILAKKHKLKLIGSIKIILLYCIRLPNWLREFFFFTAMNNSLFIIIIHFFQIFVCHMLKPQYLTQSPTQRSDQLQTIIASLINFSFDLDFTPFIFILCLIKRTSIVIQIIFQFKNIFYLNQTLVWFQNKNS